MKHLTSQVVVLSVTASVLGIIAAVALALLTGCSLVLTEASAPETREIITPQSMDDTYRRAQRAAAKMGATMLREEPQFHTFVARYKEAIALHVTITRAEEGTKMTVSGSILPKYVGYGVLSEVDDFVLAYRKETL